MNSSINQVYQKAYLIFGFVVVLMDRRIAIKESPKNIMSSDFHQKECPSSNRTDPVLARNKNGVVKQCTKHKLLAIIPNVSELLRTCKIFKTEAYKFNEVKIVYIL